MSSASSSIGQYLLAISTAIDPATTHPSSVPNEDSVTNRCAEARYPKLRRIDARRPMATIGPIVSSIAAVTPKLSARIERVDQPDAPSA